MLLYALEDDEGGEEGEGVSGICLVEGLERRGGEHVRHRFQRKGAFWSEGMIDEL